MCSPQDFCQGLGMHRHRQIKTLNLVTTQPGKTVQLIAVFNTLRNHPQIKALGHGDDGLNDCRITLVAIDVDYERSVNLDPVDRKMFQIIER
jgi:hypothetical protein